MDGDDEKSDDDHGVGSVDDDSDEDSRDYSDDEGSEGSLHEDGDLADLHKWLVEDSPDIKRLDIYTQEVVGGDRKVVIVLDEDRFPKPLCHIDRSFDVEEWREFGRAVVQKGTLEKITLRSLGVRERVRDADLLTAAERCIREFFAEMKHLKSIVKAEFFFEVISIDDLSEFIVNNEALKFLTMSSHEPVLLSLEQSDVVSRAISNAKLQILNITDWKFPNDGSFGRILEGCANVRELDVMCKHGRQCTAVAALLRDPARVIEELVLDLEPEPEPENLDLEQLFRDISASLVGNENLKLLNMYSDRDPGDDVWDCFDNMFHNLLCNTRSIQSVINSNHYIESISFEDSAGRSTEDYGFETLEELNKNDDKEEVILNKILQFYFVGKFNVSPFESMPVSVLPEVMRVMWQIKGKEKQSALYRLLQCMPQLCNVSERNSTQQPSNKRQKMI